MRALIKSLGSSEFDLDSRHACSASRKEDVPQPFGPAGKIERFALVRMLHAGSVAA